MIGTALKDMTKTRSLKAGHFIVEFATPGMGHIVKAAGCDYVFFDLEHSGFSFETLKSAVRYFEAAGVSVIARVPGKSYDLIARALDVGAEGIVAPMVGTAAEAKAVLDCMKYFPDGQRGVAVGIAHDNYGTGAVPDILAAANRRTTFFPLIETAEGADNADAIAALPGVDCLWVGHYDMSVSLGIPGEFANPKFTAAMDKVVAAAKRHGKSLGRLVPNADQGIQFYKQGFDFICYSGDVFLLREALTEGIGKIRKGVA